LASARKWDEIIRLGGQLLDRGENDPALLLPYLDQAYSMLIRSALDQEDIKEARKLLAEATVRLGDSSARLLLQAEMYQRQRDFQRAIAGLHKALALEPLLAEQIFPLIRQSMSALVMEGNGPHSMQDKMRLLSEEIINDPGYAPYYALLGRLQFEQGQYQEAISNLSYAIQLNNTLSSRLAPLVSDAKRRLSSPELVEVPINTQGETLYVDIRLNNLERRFRFILDTGASFTAITSHLVQQLGMVVTDDLPMVELTTAKGVITAPLITLQAVEMNGIGLDNVQAVILPELEGADGLLGMSFLSHFDVDINHTEHKLVLVRRR
jgi:clan AA aspartic protease (TIGR02281 family)